MNFEANSQFIVETPKPQKIYQSYSQFLPDRLKGGKDTQGENNMNTILLTSEKKNLKNEYKQQRGQFGYQDGSPCHLFVSDSLLISPVKEYKARENVNTPLRNESVFYSPSFRMDFKMDTPIEKFEFSSNRKIYAFTENKEIVQGKKINFNEEEDNEIPKEDKNEKEEIEQKNKNIPIVFHEDKNKNKICCTCTKTNCVKKYCACYANGRYCEGCECKNCLNTKENALLNKSNASSIDEEKKEKMKKSEILKRQGQVICNCTKSNCTKKYCECFKQGKECGPLCRCVGCVNKEGHNQPSQEIQIKNIPIMNQFFREFTGLKGEGLGIEINKKGISIHNRKVDMRRKIEKIKKEEEIQKTPKMTGKKRFRGKTESTNVKTPKGRGRGHRKINIKNDKVKKKRLLFQ